MLVVAGSIEFDPAYTDAVHAACVAMQQATRAEDGCIMYTLAADLEQPGLLYMIEKWTSEEALAAHFAAPHMAEFREATRPSGLKSRSALKYEIASETPLRSG